MQAISEPPPDFVDEAIEVHSRTASTVSSTSDIFQLVEENGRQYPNYGIHWYGLPVDHGEQERMARQHEHYRVSEGLLHVPIAYPPQRILDLGTGFGEWAIDVADCFPSAIVTGIDIAPVQPSLVPPNCNFEIQDMECFWDQADDTFDIIHLREPILMIRDWPHLFDQVKRCLKPGGWFEISCTHLAVQCDDGSVLDTSFLRYVVERLRDASTNLGMSLDCPLHFAQYFHDAGFGAVQTSTLPLPVTAWPTDPQLRAVGEVEHKNLAALSWSIGLRLFREAYGWPPHKTDAVMRLLRAELCALDYHPYYNRYIVCGQKR
ncbi:Methyltransferase domain-containing protein [Cladophialophora immunda]|nr:Methyltransferase domain-containing protein [Cladophialophora immunda]